jgi:hypothetical protein
MLQQPAMFLKMLVLLVPREMEVTHSNAVKAMSDQQIEDAIAAIEAMLARKRAGADAKVIDGEAVEVPALPAPRRKRRKATVKKTMDESAPQGGLSG